MKITYGGVIHVGYTKPTKEQLLSSCIDKLKEVNTKVDLIFSKVTEYQQSTLTSDKTDKDIQN